MSIRPPHAEVHAGVGESKGVAGRILDFRVPSRRLSTADREPVCRPSLSLRKPMTAIPDRQVGQRRGSPQRREWAPRMWEGCDLIGWLRLLARNRFAVNWRYWYIAVIVTVVPVVLAALVALTAVMAMT